MNKNTNSTLILHFMDGTTERYEVELPTLDPLTFGGKRDKALARNQIVLHNADRLRIIPVQNVKTFEVTIKPNSAKLPEFVFGNARLVSDT